MKFLQSIGHAVKLGAKKTGLRIKAKSPEVLLVCGAITFVGTIVVACKQTTKAEEILDNHERKINDILEVQQMAEEEPDKFEYTEQDAKKDKAIAFVQTGWEFTKLYAPVIILGAVSLTCFGASYGIMRKRNVALSVAYGALDSAFKEYRGRVKDKMGEDADSFFRYGYKKLEGAKVFDPNTKEIVEKDVDTVPWDEERKEGDGTLDNATFLFAPETSKYYQSSEVHNDVSISACRNNMQIDFDIQGYLFLNDVLKALGMQPVPYGQLVGWLKGYGDNYVDFRVKKIYREVPVSRRRNGSMGDYEAVYEFDFNTCGIIWDKI